MLSRLAFTISTKFSMCHNLWVCSTSPKYLFLSIFIFLFLSRLYMRLFDYFLFCCSRGYRDIVLFRRISTTYLKFSLSPSHYQSHADSCALPFSRTYMRRSGLLFGVHISIILPIQTDSRSGFAMLQIRFRSDCAVLHRCS
jgi:hypothetical protein